MSNIKARQNANDAISRIEATEKRIEGIFKKIHAHFTDKVEIVKVGTSKLTGRKFGLIKVNGKLRVQYL